MKQTSTKDEFIANVARRLYMHALKGGRIKASDMARVVEVMEMTQLRDMKMTREFKVGDRVVSGTAPKFGVGRVVGEGKVRFENYSYMGDDDYHSLNNAIDIRHADPVPIGYTGKLRDMDLQEGDVVENERHRTRHSVKRASGDKVIYDDGWDRANGADYTLISRATQATPPDQWSDWQLSRKDGTMSQQYAEVQTVPLDDTQQVVYRGRGVAPEMGFQMFTIVGVHYCVTTIDGQPDWDTVEDVG